MKRKILPVLLLLALVLCLSGCQIVNLMMAVPVPDVTGLELEDAARMLARDSLEYSAVYIPSDDVREGFVITQSPAEGERLAKGDSVVLAVSTGPETLTMPDLIGHTADEALAALKAMGLMPDTERVMDGTAAPDTVIGQDPEPGEPVQANGRVSIRLSGGKAAVPRLTWMTLAEAEEQIRRMGLGISPVLSFVESPFPADHGRIASQYPAEEQDAMLGTEVSLSVFTCLSDRSQVRYGITLPDAGEEILLRAMLQPEGSGFEYEGFAAVVSEFDERDQEITIRLPDCRTYTCRIYENGEVAEVFTVRNETVPEIEK